MQLMWEGRPGNTTVRTEAFTVTENGHIHQTAHFFPVANMWQHHIGSLDTTEGHQASYTPALIGTHVNNPG